MDELNKIPPVTRTLLFATLAVTVPCLLKVVNPYLFLLWWPAVVKKWQVWRPFTAFFFGGSGLELLFDIFLLYRNSNDLEMNKFYRKTADYAWALTLINILILLTNYPLSSPVLFRPLMMALVYLWSRANEHASVSLFGLINCPAKYLPYTYLGFDLLRGGPPYAIQSATGLLSAYIYDFFKEVLPATNGGRGPRYIPDTPAFLRTLLPDSIDPATRGQTPQPGGSVRSTSWGGTAFAPAGRSFGDDRSNASATSTAGGNRLDSETRGAGLGRWLPFGRGSSVGDGTSTSNSRHRTQPDRDAMLAAAESRLRSLRENSIAGRNQAASAAASRAANSAEAQARSAKASAQASSSAASSVLRGGESSRSTGVRRSDETVATRRSGQRSTFGSLGAREEKEDESEEQETASGSGGRVAEIRRAESGDTPLHHSAGRASESNEGEHSWGGGRRLGDS